MSKLSQLITQNGGFAILDGAIATQLEKRGYQLEKNLWSSTLLKDHPEAIEQLHYDYFCAGADIGTSCSYQASFEGFKSVGIDEKEAERLMKKSVELVKSASDRFYDEYQKGIHGNNRCKPLVAASVSCYGASITGDVAQEFSGSYVATTESSVIFEFHKKRVQCLLDAGPDILLFETVPALAEAKIINNLLQMIILERDLPPVIISFSCKDGEGTCYGDKICECAEFIQNCDQIAGLSINCTNPHYVVSLLGFARQHTTKILCCYPNSGEIYDASSSSWKQSENSTDHLNFHDLSLLFRKNGATIIGGCCRTDPADILQISNALRNKQ